MADLTDHLSEKFRQSELVVVAEAVGMSPTSRWGSRKLIDAIFAKVRKDGVPPYDEDGKDAELVDDFLYVAELIDEDGNPTIGGDDDIDLDTYCDEHGIEELPDCFGFADDEAPECKRCELYTYCAEDRLHNLPPCYGLMYSSGRECQACMEAPYCKSK